jgi:NAD(P)-dependent dehydrogenase (short-subunit alcohol dehydrogenase family)
MPTSKRIALVTGAAQGIGRTTAQLLAARGYAVVLNDVNSAAATQAAIEAAGGEAFETLGDVSSETDVTRITKAALSRYGRLDALVNNAGISFIRDLADIEPAEWRRVLEVNLTGPYLLCRAFASTFLAQKAGSIVNVASIAGLAGIASRSAYNASKHGLIGLTRTLAAEWGGYGIRSNAVCPGWVKTEMDHVDQAKKLYSDADIENRVPMGRFASPNDVAEAIGFLADPDRSAFVNGAELRVDGGWLTDFGWESLRLAHR